MVVSNVRQMLPQQQNFCENQPRIASYAETENVYENGINILHNDDDIRVTK